MTTIVTKEDLLQALNEVPAGAEIRIAQPTHDYWHTQLAVAIKGVVRRVIEHTPYHNADQIVAVDEEGKKTCKTVWVLDF